MHDLIFENQSALLDRHLRKYAGMLALDQARFDEELAAHVHAGRVRRDFAGGIRSGVNGTPTFFINGARYDGDWDLASLADALGYAMTVRDR